MEKLRESDGGFAQPFGVVRSPQYVRLPSYFGQPFVFSMLHDYGGTIGMYGKVEDVVNGSHAARNNFR